MPTQMQDKIAALEGEIYSKRAWLEQHGKHAKKPRPDWEITSKEAALTWLEAVADDYRKSLERAKTNENG
jgi:hypothetical protein